MLRLSPKITLQRHAKQTLTLSHCRGKLPRDCSAKRFRPIFLHICSCENKPIERQGQRKRRRRKHYYAPAKQDTSKQPPLRRKSHWHGNENTQPSKTLRLRSETTRRASKATIPAQGHKNDTLQVIQTTCKNALTNGAALTFHLRTLANACGRLRTQRRIWRTHADPQAPFYNGNPSLRIWEQNLGLRNF